MQTKLLALGVLGAILVGASAFSVNGLIHERRHAQELAASNQALSDSLRQVQNELRTVSTKLNEMAAQTPPAAVPSHGSQSVKPKAAPRTATVRTADDPRWKQLQSRLNDQAKLLDQQQRELASTREEAGQTRQDLQDRINSTRDDLSGSIAKNHDELVALQKRGERNYYEFQLDRSKQFQKIGPIGLSLRKVNPKHKYYDLALMVDDQQLEKKHVNLFEPLMVSAGDRPQPIELVVNDIRNNVVKGYVSEPKYRRSELASGTPSAADGRSLQRRPVTQ